MKTTRIVPGSVDFQFGNYYDVTVVGVYDFNGFRCLCAYSGASISVCRVNWIMVGMSLN